MYTIPTATVRRITKQIRRQMKHNEIKKADPVDEAMTLDMPRRMLDVIAISLNMSPVCYQLKSRKQMITDLRFLGAMMLRQKFPGITLKEIAALFGGQDHTSIMNGIEKAHAYIHTGDCRFTPKYYTARRSVNSWIVRNNIDVMQQIPMQDSMMPVPIWN
jgi:chromosomal replication initiation ATPase DnaA